MLWSFLLSFLPSSSTQPMCLSKVTLKPKLPICHHCEKRQGRLWPQRMSGTTCWLPPARHSDPEGFLQGLPAFVYLHRTWVLTHTHLGADLFRCQILLFPAPHLKRVIYFHFLHFLTSHSNTAIQLQLISTLPKAVLSEARMLSNQMAS